MIWENLTRGRAMQGLFLVDPKSIHILVEAELGVHQLKMVRIRILICYAFNIISPNLMVVLVLVQILAQRADWHY